MFEKLLQDKKIVKNNFSLLKSEYHDLKNKEINVLNQLPDIGLSLEEKISNALIIFSIFMTIFTIFVGFYSSFYKWQLDQNGYFDSKIKSFIFINSLRINNIKTDIEFINEYQSALNNSKQSEFYVLENIRNAINVLEKTSDIENIYFKKGEVDFQFSIVFRTEDSDVKSKIEDIKIVYPSIKDLRLEKRSSDVNAEYIVFGRISK